MSKRAHRRPRGITSAERAAIDAAFAELSRADLAALERLEEDRARLMTEQADEYARVSPWGSPDALSGPETRGGGAHG